MNERLLKASELSIELGKAYVFDSQHLVKYASKPRQVMAIDRKCLGCGKKDTILVSSIIMRIKKGKETGLCRSCGKKGRVQPRGIRSASWKGGKHSTKQGYIMMHKPEHPKAQNGYVQEHRVVMEQEIGRFLSKGETVHHKNGIRSDNRIENLELWGRKHSDGGRYTDLTTDDLKLLIDDLQKIIDSRKS